MDSVYMDKYKHPRRTLPCCDKEYIKVCVYCFIFFIVSAYLMSLLNVWILHKGLWVMSVVPRELMHIQTQFSIFGSQTKMVFNIT